MLDIFRGDAFGVVPLTLAINNLKFVPGYVSSRGLFSTSSIATTAFSIEEKNNTLTLVRPTPRGGPGQTQDRGRRSMRMLSVPHFEINDAVMAEEVQGVRPFGQEDGTEQVMTKVAERMAQAGQSLEYTQEYSRVGAIKGVITYADGTKLDLFNEYNLPVPPNIDMNLDFAGTPDGSLRLKCAGIVRTMGANLDGISFTGVEALCGDAFFDAFIKHPEVRQTYLNYQAAAELRQGYVDAGGLVWASFPFGGILWTNYRGNVGTTPMIETNMAYLYPIGVPDLFSTVFAPADYIETVNTMGKPRYVKQYPMPNDKGINLDVQMNALNFCTKPLALQRAILT
ncbi:major capsid protein [Bradyrhizobium sp. BRP22]|uniref:major capsid protein n=1 Tax=Bradyrhizobium sp. BRP22 TaxID=2793821 RepID=UPI001CD1E94C|nr:major capsid protein [Bradyrhizobium sp. BRP22]MCA1452845.1 major capsid protein [Bradyrhizobium sp. BRP22]